MKEERPPSIDELTLSSIEDRQCSLKELQRCMQCGKCTASCPASFIFEGFSPRDVMLRAMSGEIEELVLGKEIWQCGQCLSCAARCPRDCSPAVIIQVLRIMALRFNPDIDYMRQIEKGVKRNLYKTGQTILPDTLILPKALLGPRTRKRYKATFKNRRKLGYRMEDSRRVAIPEEDLAKIRMLLQETDYIE